MHMFFDEDVTPEILQANKQLITKAAAEIDQILAKAGKANGIVTRRNFTMVADRMGLVGHELRLVGTGYSAEGDTLEAQLASLVSQIRSAVETGPVAVKAEKPDPVLVDIRGVDSPMMEESQPDSRTVGTVVVMVEDLDIESGLEDDNLEEIMGDEEVAPTPAPEKPKPVAKKVAKKAVKKTTKKSK